MKSKYNILQPNFLDTQCYFRYISTSKKGLLIKKVFRILDNLQLEIAYSKAKVCRTKNCFDFLGFHISTEGLGVAKRSVRKLAERIIMKLDSVNKAEKSRTYGLGCSGINSMKGDLSIPDCISKYVQRWMIWIKAIDVKEIQSISETGSIVS